MTDTPSPPVSAEAAARFEAALTSGAWFERANATAALAGADECGSDGGGDVWYVHLAPETGDQILVILSHQTGRWYEDVWHDGVLSVLQGGEGSLELGNWEYDEIRAAEEVALAGRDRAVYEAALEHTRLAVRRADALVALLSGRVVTEPHLLARDSAVLDVERTWPHFRDSCALWWAWVTWLAGDADGARSLANLARQATVHGVAPAAAALLGLLDGRSDFAGASPEDLRRRHAQLHRPTASPTR